MVRRADWREREFMAPVARSGGSAQNITRRCTSLTTRVQDNADRRQDDEQREDGGDLEIGVVDQQQVAEPAVRADELADDRADDAEHDADVEPGEDEGQRGRQADHAEGLPAARLQRRHQIDPILLDRLRRPATVFTRIGKKAITAVISTFDCDAEAEPDHQQRRERDLWHRLQRDDVGVDEPVDDAELCDQRAEHQRIAVAPSAKPSRISQKRDAEMRKDVPEAMIETRAPQDARSAAAERSPARSSSRTAAFPGQQEASRATAEMAISTRVQRSA